MQHITVDFRFPSELECNQAEFKLQASTPDLDSEQIAQALHTSIWFTISTRMEHVVHCMIYSFIYFPEKVFIPKLLFVFSYTFK